VLDIDIKDQRDVGPYDIAQPRDFAALVSATFEHRGAMLASKHEDSHRHADEIVEIARRRERFTENCAHQSCGEFLGCGFASGTSNGDGGQPAAGADPLEMMACERTQCRERVIYLEAWQIRMAPPLLDNCRRRSGLRRGANEFVAVAYTAQRHEERPLSQIAAVERDSFNPQIGQIGPAGKRRICGLDNLSRIENTSICRNRRCHLTLPLRTLRYGRQKYHGTGTSAD